jgi:transketolase
MNINPKNPQDENRDRFVLSAGHKALALYTALAFKGFYDKELLYTYSNFKSIFGGHPDASKVPGIEISTGSLGHGLPIGVGMALAGKLLKKNFKVFVLMGDGELAEGSNWEAALAAKHYRLDNLIGIIDKNGLCADGTVCEVMDIEPLNEKWKAFGWSLAEIDGHDIQQIFEVLENIPLEKSRPTIIIANTIKGKGCSFMENKYEWHNKVPSKEQFEIAYGELKCNF